MEKEKEPKQPKENNPGIGRNKDGMDNPAGIQRGKQGKREKGKVLQKQPPSQSQSQSQSLPSMSPSPLQQNSIPAEKLFLPHFGREVAEQLYEKKKCLKGFLRINPRNYEDAFVTSPDDPSMPDIYVAGVRDRNRALNGDEVLVDLHPSKDWKVLGERIRDYLEAKEDAKEQLTAEDLALKMAALKFNSDKDAEAEPEKARNGTPAAPAAAPPPEAPPLEPAREQGAQASSPPESPPSEAAEQNGEADADAASEGDDAANADKASPAKKKKTRRSKRKPKPKEEKSLPETKPLPTIHQRPKSPPVQHRQQQNRRRQQSTSPSPYDIKVVLAHPHYKRFVQRTGRIIYICEKRHSRFGAGFLTIFPDKNPRFAKFSPTDPCVPRMKIPRDQCPQDFFMRPQDFKTRMFACQIIKWDQVNMAMGQLTKNLGDGNDMGARTEALLIQHEIDDRDFSRAVEACLPSVPFALPVDEIAKRRDFRKECVFTIDPLTARDLDDALSVEKLPDGNFRVGVHIADVAYFVKEGTELDRVAADRATSVYLVHKVVPMLPRTLCEHLCSLNPSEDRLTFSVEWVMTPEGKIVDEWFGRSVIRSCVKLAYEHAQGMLDNPKKDWTKEEVPAISAPYNASVISDKVNYLQSLAVKLRLKREANGALRLDQPKLSFFLDRETGLPQGYQLYEHRHSNRLIEEFMLLANIAVAKKICGAFPQMAVLRRHPKPKGQVMEKTREMLGKFGIELDSSDSLSLATSLRAYAGSSDPGSQRKFLILVSLCSKAMELARYFCTGVELPEGETEAEHFRHYALSVDLYTHFTSPIRRYPDLLVHRLLDAAIQEGGRAAKSPAWATAAVAKQAEWCNKRKLSAKMAGDDSAALFLALFVKECGPITTKAMVIQILDKAVDCLIFELADVKRVYMDKLEPECVVPPTFSRRAGKAELKLIWKPRGEVGAAGQPTAQMLRLFTEVTVTLTANPDKAFEYLAVIEPNSCVGGGGCGAE